MKTSISSEIHPYRNKLEESTQENQTIIAIQRKTCFLCIVSYGLAENKSRPNIAS